MARHYGLKTASQNILINGERTSVRLEPAIWNALREIAAEQGTTINDIATTLDHSHEERSLSAALRIYVVEYYRAKLRDRDVRPASGTASCALAPAPAAPDWPK